MRGTNFIFVFFAECLEWFDQVEQTWDKPTYAEGRLVACNNMCGGCK